jgi:hypothetical protein
LHVWFFRKRWAEVSKKYKKIALNHLTEVIATTPNSFRKRAIWDKIMVTNRRARGIGTTAQYGLKDPILENV